MPRNKSNPSDPSQSAVASVLPPSIHLTASPYQIASLWSSYGFIHRLQVTIHPEIDPHNPDAHSNPRANAPASRTRTLILKTVNPPPTAHPSESHLRKLLSYRVERYFYHRHPRFARHAHLSNNDDESGAKVAAAYAVEDEHALLLEDLRPSFPHESYGSLNQRATCCVLDWLADYHARFWKFHARTEGRGALHLVPPPLEVQDAERAGAGDGVWAQGTYWYLDTRREELAQTDEDENAWLMPWIERVNGAVKQAARSSGTLLHGDVKSANILFSHPPNSASAANAPPLRCALYDFQYVGLGIPTHDLVYFLGTSVASALLRSEESEMALLKYYHAALHARFELADRVSGEKTIYEWDTFMQHWELSIVDWYRFMAGWGFWGDSDWVERRAKAIVARWTQDGWPY